MDSNQVLEIGREAVWLLLKISAPVMIVALLVGVLVSLFQALTQIQEATLSFVPKMIAIFACLVLTAPWMIASLKLFSERISEYIIYLP